MPKSKTEIMALSNSELIESWAQATPDASLHKYEMQRRLLDPGFRRWIKMLDTPPSARRDEMGEIDREPTKWPEGGYAREVLDSGWDFSGMSSSPADVQGFLTMVFDGNLSERDMTPKMLRFFWSIKNHYRRFKLGQA